MVGVAGLEPATSASRTLRAKPTALHPALCKIKKLHKSVNPLTILFLLPHLPIAVNNFNPPFGSSRRYKPQLSPPKKPKAISLSALSIASTGLRSSL